MSAGEHDPVAAAAQLLHQGRAAEALALIAPLAAAEAPSHRTLFVQSSVLRTLGRHEAALQVNRKAIELYPDSGVAWHNLAALLGDLGRADEAKAAAERAFTLRLDAPETWLVYARALHNLFEFDASEKAFRRVLASRPADLHAAVELSRLIWMRRGDARAAVELLETTMKAGAPETPMVLAINGILDAAGAEAQARAARLDDSLRRRPDDVALLRAAAQAALESGDEDRGEKLAARAESLAPHDVGAKIQHASLLLAQGRAQAALNVARRATELEPNNQAAWAWLATAARAADHPTYRWLCDYEAFVQAYDIPAPPGWPDLEHWLADLRSALHRLHQLSFQPPELTLRRGVQTTVELTQVADPAIRGFFAAIEAPIRTFASTLRNDQSHPLTRRKAREYRVGGSWSVLLKPNGFHIDHFHPLGWLSSAFYVEVPEAVVDSRDREGWIRFGQPPFKTVPAMGPERYVQPKPGRLVLFPSYMWHGTVPFTASEPRMTIAFDVVPATE